MVDSNRIRNNVARHLQRKLWDGFKQGKRWVRNPVATRDEWPHVPERFQELDEKGVLANLERLDWPDDT